MVVVTIKESRIYTIRWQWLQLKKVEYTLSDGSGNNIKKVEYTISDGSCNNIKKVEYTISDGSGNN